jgi:hypothetical protein
MMAALAASLLPEKPATLRRKMAPTKECQGSSPRLQAACPIALLVGDVAAAES